MKAIIVNEYGGPDVMKIEDVATPKPEGTQVLVRVKATGVNPVDTYLRSGNHAHRQNFHTRRARMRRALWDLLVPM